MADGIKIIGLFINIRKNIMTTIIKTSLGVIHLKIIIVTIEKEEM